MSAPADEATRRQVAAADPARSTWLAANAGSGKTRVLTDRVARLLLTGTPPQNVLCLTYTKAAAGEMQNRLFAQLGGWAMLDDDALRAELAAKGVPEAALSADRLDAARRLFAAAIEAPGGLKIQTIHAFCAALLRQFPLEARVSPTFTELDEVSAARLHEDILESMATEGGEGAAAIDAVAAHLSSDETLTTLTRDVLSLRDAFDAPFTLSDALAAHGLAPCYEAIALRAEIFLGGEADLIARLIPQLHASGGNDAKAAEKLSAALEAGEIDATLAALESALLTGESAAEPFTAKIGSLPKKALRAAMDAGDLAAFENLMARVEAARPRRLALASAVRSAALNRFARVFLARTEAEKTRRGVLDFDDLILRARRLLGNPAVGAWVLFKLDGGIDHILVDEAQDTSPAQWDVIARLAEEISAGAGSRDGVARTIFVVGDKKQSIYSFQGADPAGFDRWRAHFDTRLAEDGGLAGAPLEHSFRSSPAILEAVDATFADTAPGALGGPPAHVAFRDTLPGRVDLWPLVPKHAPTEAADWTDPQDLIQPDAPEARLAAMIAAEVRRLIDVGETLPRADGSRALLTEGDVLVLVQRRGALFREVIRACKAAGLAVAGADRLKLTGDLAVRDLVALLAFLALPEDDLALAECLRSPLFGWSEDALYRLAQPRRGYLWAALREGHAGSEAHAILSDLRDHADFLRPYDLLERMLTVHGGRERLLARLGSESAEALDALLDEALAFEAAEVPSLTGFVEWMRADEKTIKRQEAGGAALRVMTVHGAKGLESDLVILPDCGVRRASALPEVLPTGAGWVAWGGAKALQPPEVRDAADAIAAARQEESQRLLYVAMTRARAWLWVCACGAEDTRGESWHSQVRGGLERCGAVPFETPAGEGLRLARHDWTAPRLKAAEAESGAPATLPDWAAGGAPPPPPPRPSHLAPSDLGGAKALPGEAGGDEAAALRRGRQVHLLLERLPDYPEASWAALAPALLSMGDAPADPGDIGALLSEATGVLTDPALKPLFAPDTLSEVAVTMPLPDGRRLSGTIDRLIVAPDDVRAVDFKTNAVVPGDASEVPEGLLRQMGAYRAALAMIYPGRRVDTALLWTRTARLMPLPDALVDAAWRAALDGSDGGQYVR